MTHVIIVAAVLTGSYIAISMSELFKIAGSQTEYLKATLGLVKRLEILIHECVTVPGCCCYMPLLHNHLMDPCSYVCKKYTTSCQKGVHLPIALTPLPLNPPLVQ